jgi:hypothetical protein
MIKLTLVIYVLVWFKLTQYASVQLSHLCFGLVEIEKYKCWLLYIFCGVSLYIQKPIRSLHSHGSS